MTGQGAPGGRDELDEALSEMMADPAFRAAHAEACRRSAVRDAAVDAMVMAGAHAAESLAWLWGCYKAGGILRKFWVNVAALAALFLLWRLGCWVARQLGRPFRRESGRILRRTVSLSL